MFRRLFCRFNRIFLQERKESPVFQMTNHTIQDNETVLVNNKNEDYQAGENTAPSSSVTTDHVNQTQPITAATIQNEILNGNITYSCDPEGKDLPKGWKKFSPLLSKISDSKEKVMCVKLQPNSTCCIPISLIHYDVSRHRLTNTTRMLCH